MWFLSMSMLPIFVRAADLAEKARVLAEEQKEALSDNRLALCCSRKQGAA